MFESLSALLTPVLGKVARSSIYTLKRKFEDGVNGDRSLCSCHLPRTEADSEDWTSQPQPLWIYQTGQWRSPKALLKSEPELK
jgi:hypothetical protein